VQPVFMATAARWELEGRLATNEASGTTILDLAGTTVEQPKLE